MRSPFNGTVLKMHAEEGQEVNVDEVLFDLAPGSVTIMAKVPAPELKLALKAEVQPVPVTKPDKAEVEVKKVSHVTGDRTESRVKMTRMRQRIAQRLKESQNTAAMLTTFQEVDMTNLIDLRNKYKEEFEKNHGVKLGFMSAFVRVCSLLRSNFRKICLFRLVLLHFWKHLR